MTIRPLLLLIIALLPVKNIGQTLDFTWLDNDAKSKAASLEQQFKSINSAVGNEYDLTYLRLLFTVDHVVHYITGSVTSYFRVLSEAPHT